MTNSPPPLRLYIGGKNYCLTCPHFDGEKCIKLPYEYCRITRSN